VNEEFDNRRASRRGFFREAFAGLLEPVVELLRYRLGIEPAGEQEAPDRPPLRPPGAAAGDAFARLCTACGDCARACPVEAIVLEPLPQIRPARRPCSLCEALPCVAACKTSALELVRREEVSMGLAMWDGPSCLLASGASCSLCAQACPLPGTLRIEGGNVIVDGARCTGCGTCEHYCPARPRAIVVEPF
jgi:ferredoxin-type protein NapG